MAVVLALAASGCSNSAPARLTVGFADVPPLAYLRPDGTAAGFAVDVLEEAARREGVTLTWQEMPPDMADEEVLRRGLVDLLPSLYDTPAHKQEFYITSPWWTPEWTLVVRDESGIWDERRIGPRRLRISGPDVVIPPFRERFMEAHVTASESPGAVLKALCRGDVDAAAFIRLELSRVLLMHVDACNGVSLHEVPTGIAADLSLAARPAVRDMAKRLRARIDELTVDGTLARIAERNPPVPASIALLAARNLKDLYQRRIWTAVLACMSLVLGLCLFFSLGQRRVAAKLRESQQRLARAHAIAKLGNWEVELAPGSDNPGAGRYYWSDEVYGIFGVTKETFTPTREAFLSCVAPDDRERVLAAVRRALSGGNAYEVEHRVVHPDGSLHFVREQAELVRDASGKVVRIAGTVQDISEYKRLEQEFHQAQKLESVARLAGGVAHDFNNLLTVIGGYSELALAEIDERDPKAGGIAEIRKAAERGAALTRQLLTFSRRQVVEPKVLDLNTTIGDIEKMLRRLIGEHIRLESRLNRGAGPVLADAGQIQQVLVNLAVNARDAMPSGGTLAIETGEVQIEEQLTDGEPEIKPGSYVVLTVSDTGTGMDEQTQAHLFEPFFTTKPRGSGTGLGLATVHGIVSQSGGWIRVQTELGKGTTFRIFLPRADSAERDADLPALAPPELRGNETVLVVEDQPEVRKLAREILRRRGYTVIEASNGAEALSICDSRAEPIQLALMDVVMPGQPAGHELATRIRAIRPEVKVLFMSGYTDEMIAQRGVLHDGVSYLAKPFTPEGLARKVRQVLGEGDSRTLPAEMD